MTLLNIVIVLIVVGVLLWLVNTYIPMDGKIKKILNVVVVVVVIIWLLKVFGLFDNLTDIHVSNLTALIQPEKNKI
jgi:hypothetical protein